MWGGQRSCSIGHSSNPILVQHVRHVSLPRPTHAHHCCRYKNLDKLIRHVNRDGRVNAFYSTPAE